jgi:Pentapeptide repeats (9 copies)
MPLLPIRKSRLPVLDVSPDDSSVQPLQPVHVWRWAATGLACAMVAASIVTYVMWSIASVIPDHAARAGAELTALKSGLATAAGVAAIFGGLLALRRQWASEIEAVVTAAGAAEERTIEIYANAAEALGSDRAAARIAALFALERLGMEVPSQAQAVCSLLCSYLQIPFTPPDTTLKTVRSWGKVPAKSKPDPQAVQDELAVRLVAQRILIRHLRLRGAIDLRTGRSALWRDMVLDLSEACLVGADFSGCVFGQVDFGKAIFYGTTSFRGCTFTKPAKFARSAFNSEARFARCSFRERADFDEVSFCKDAEFTDASFTWGATFEGATFTDAPDFSGATIRRPADGEVQRTWPGGWRLRCDDGICWLRLPGARTPRPRPRPVRVAVQADDAQFVTPDTYPPALPGLMGMPAPSQDGGLLGHDREPVTPGP